MQWVVAHIFDSWWTESNNPYSLDIATNIIFYSLERPLINNILARREARRLFTVFQTKKSIILSMLEWADSFGANVLSLEDQLMGIEADGEGAIEAYVEQDYQTTIDFLESLSQEVAEISDEAVRLKDEAMFWVYISEWLAVTSTGIMTGFILWTLMVRRRMFREVTATRFGA
jgi:hypothetical protein